MLKRINEFCFKWLELIFIDYFPVIMCIGIPTLLLVIYYY